MNHDNVINPVHFKPALS